jgi:hypothetical protein
LGDHGVRCPKQLLNYRLVQILQVPSNLISAIPEPAQRGSFSAVGASLQQLSGGLGSVLAAALIAQDADGSLRHFDRLGYVVVTTAVISLIVMYFVQRPIAAQAGKRVV